MPGCFEILSEIRGQETFAVGSGIRELRRLVDQYGKGRWRKRRGFATVRRGESVFEAELHWYEAHGVGKVEFKIKRRL